MAAVWQGRAAALFVLLTVLGNWFSGAGDVPTWVRFVAILAAFVATVVVYNRRHLVNVIRVLPRDLRYVVDTEAGWDDSCPVNLKMSNQITVEK